MALCHRNTGFELTGFMALLSKNNHSDRLGHEKVSTTLNTYSHLFPHKQQELVNNLEQLSAAASVTSTPEPPDGNPLLEAANLPYGPAPLTEKKHLPKSYRCLQER